MPSYKTHSVHGEIILPSIDRKIEIDKDDIETFCIGPDTMIATDNKLFDYQHTNKVKQYFENLLKLIKQNKLQDNSSVMSFLYGQLDHYILDTTTHPLIYYVTEDMPKKHLLTPHSIVEMWIDDYILEKYNKNEVQYYNKSSINNKELKKIINTLYKETYGSKFAYLKYKYGMKLINMFDTLVRKKYMKPIPSLIKLFNVGDITYHKNNEKVLQYLNLNNDVWYNPETGEVTNDSFDDLWKKSLEVSLQTIDDVNGYLYSDKELKNAYIKDDISYSTGLPCDEGQHFTYIKKYKRNK